ncbi:MAG: hypothetical protein P8N09_04700 [Planctomycetota bacterium]|nr:hypothetical protein [Planctomycetota bacterium]
MHLAARALYVLFAFFALWKYFTEHFAEPNSHLARESLGAILVTVATAAILAGFSALCYLIWSKPKRETLLRMLSTRIARLTLIVILTAGLLTVIFGVDVLPDFALLLGVGAGALVYFAVHAAFGSRLLRRGPTFENALGKTSLLLFGWLLGMGLHAVGLFSISTFMVSPLLVSLTIVAVMAWLGRLELAGYLRLLVSGRPKEASPQSISSRALWWGAFGAVAFGVVFLNPARVASPPWHFDAMHVHLASAKSYLASGGITFIPQLRSSFQIPLLQLQFTPLLAILGELGPKLLEGTYLLALGMITHSLVRRIMPTAKLQAARLAALLVCATPIVMSLAGICYLGLPATVYLTATLELALVGGGLLIASKAEARNVGAVLGAFLAFVFLAKIQAWAVALPVMLLMSVAMLRTAPAARLKCACTFVSWGALIAILLASPLLIRNTLAMGNPLWPFLGDVFGNKDDIMSAEEMSRLSASIGRLGMGHSLWDFITLPYRIVIHEDRFQGGGFYAFGVVWLLALPAMFVGLFRKSLWWAMPFILSFTIPWFFTTQELRYLIYILPVAAVLAVSGIERMHLRGRRPYGVIAGIILVSSILQAGGWDSDQETLALQGEQRESFLERKISGYRAMQWLAEHSDDQTKIFAQGLEGAKYAFLQPANVLGDHFGKFRYSQIMTAQGSFRSAGVVVPLLKEYGVSYVAIRDKGAHYSPSLRLETDTELAQHLKLVTILDNVFIYEFHHEGDLQPSALSLEDVNLIQDDGFNDTKHVNWIIVGEEGKSVHFDTERGTVLLKSKGGIKQVIPTSITNERPLYSFEVEARAVDAHPSALRLQVVWLPETEYDDPSLVVAGSLLATPSLDQFHKYSFVSAQSDHAVKATIALINDGESDIEIQSPALRQVNLH